MLDTNVKFEDVSAETIAMEFVQFEDVDADTLAMEHFEDLRVELNLDSVWSIWDGGCMPADYALFNKKMRKVTYTFVRPDATLNDIQADLEDGGNRSTAKTSAWAMDGTVKNLWIAANSCIEQSGTHHRYIENFELLDNGSLDLVTGS